MSVDIDIGISKIYDIITLPNEIMESEFIVYINGYMMDEHKDYGICNNSLHLYNYKAKTRPIEISVININNGKKFVCDGYNQYCRSIDEDIKL